MEKNKKNIISEEIKKFNLMVDYDFYTGNINEGFPLYKENIPKSDNDDKLLFGSDIEEAEEPEENQEIDNQETDDNENITDKDIENELKPQLDNNQEPEQEIDITPEDEVINQPSEEPIDDSVELDVTDIVNSTEEVKASSDAANDKIEKLLSMVDKLESQINSMSKITDKIDNLEMEIEKRNPTPVEKLEMRSLNSYPYNIKLTDFWKDKGLLDEPEEEKENEYILTSDDIDNDYNEYDIKNSFDFDEEEI